MLHGYLSSSKYWNNLTPHLQKAGHNVIALDLLGFGKSPQPKNINYSYEDHVGHIKLGLDAISGPFILVGHSMGGLIALRYAKLYPEHVSGLILLNPPLYKNSAQVHQTLKSTSSFYRAIIYSKLRRFIWRFLKLVPHPYVGRHGYEAREKSLINVIVKAEALEDLKTIKTKTLLMVGLKDRPIYLKNLEGYELSKTAKLVKEEVDHHAPARQPGLISRIINDFISESV